MPICPNCNHEFKYSIKYATSSEQDNIDKSRKTYRRMVLWNKFGWISVLLLAIALYMTLVTWQGLMEVGFGYMFNLGLLLGGLNVFFGFYLLNYIKIKSRFREITEVLKKEGYEIDELNQFNWSTLFE